MAIPEWLRRLGKLDPGYGVCGGYNRDCAPPQPVDKMDMLFQEHDQNLYQTNFLEEPEKSIARKEADKILAQGLRKDLKPYSRKIYGPIYHFFAKMVFR